MLNCMMSSLCTRIRPQIVNAVNLPNMHIAWTNLFIVDFSGLLLILLIIGKPQLAPVYVIHQLLDSISLFHHDHSEVFNSNSCCTIFNQHDVSACKTIQINCDIYIVFYKQLASEFRMSIFINSLAAVLVSKGNSIYFRKQSDFQLPSSFMTCRGIAHKKQNVQPPCLQLCLKNN